MHLLLAHLLSASYLVLIRLKFLEGDQSIDKGQFEAAKVLGFSKFKFYKIILPQMLRLAIPNLSNVWQIHLKILL